MKMTLDEIAQKAGVSRATVDRVINDRGRVKQSTADRVYKALFHANYFINVGSEPSDKIIYRFDFIFPNLKTRYFDNFVTEIKNSELAFAGLNTKVRPHMVDDLKPETLAKKLVEIGGNTDGIAFVALDHPIVRGAVDELSGNGIGVVSLVSDISRSKRLAYVGIDNRAAGRTAAQLMGSFLGAKESGYVALFPGRPSYRGHEEREAGFKSMMRERYDRFEIVDMPGAKYDNNVAKEKVLELLLDKPNVVSIYNTAGGNHGIAEALKESGRGGDVIFIAHELSSVTKSYLIDNTIDVIINQDIRHELFYAVELLIRHKKQIDVELSVRQPRLEIYLAENVY